MKALTKAELMNRLETLRELAGNEDDYTDYCKLQAEIWELEIKLNELEDEHDTR